MSLDENITPSPGARYQGVLKYFKKLYFENNFCKSTHFKVSLKHQLLRKSPTINVKKH